MSSFLVLPFAEIEIRLGTINKSNFDSCIDRKYFDQIKNALETGSFLIENINSVEHINNALSLKLINNDSILMKENIVTKNIQVNSSPFDIRFAVNQEFSLDSYLTSFTKTNFTRTKSRRSYIHDDFKYDLTIVNERNNNISKDKYEIEIELLVNKNTLTWTDQYINDFLECKIYDLVNIVEPLEREKFKIKLI
jgi:hypothetical protein